MPVNQYQLFVDLDGVLADFDLGVRRACGREPSEMEPRRMWPVLARTPGFYARLEWMNGGRQLWNALRPFAPVILTGMPMGKWAEPQKRKWCSEKLGNHIPVLTGLSRHKPELARQWMEEHNQSGKIPLLIDDRLKQKGPWEDAGGVFILHLSTEDSLRTLRELGFKL